MREPSLDLSQSDVLQFLELTPDGVFAQRAGIIVFANAAFAAAMRVPAPSSLVGKELLSIIAPGDRAQIAGQLRERGPGLARPPADVRCLRADGSIAIFEYSAMRVVAGSIVIPAKQSPIPYPPRRLLLCPLSLLYPLFLAALSASAVPATSAVFSFLSVLREPPER